jgi:hypothetical protein
MSFQFRLALPADDSGIIALHNAFGGHNPNRTSAMSQKRSAKCRAAAAACLDPPPTHCHTRRGRGRGVDRHILTDEAPLLPDDRNSLVLVDFDYSLLASNSTELFIASCKPSIIASLIHCIIRRCIPWRWTGVTHGYRLGDYLCVLALCILTPWNIWLWKRRAPALFARYRSQHVTDLIGQIPSERTIVVSFGVAPIIRALLAGSRFEGVRVVATPLLSGISRFQHGKKRLAIEAIGDEQARAATLITDSDDDADLLAYCAHGIKIPQQGTTFDARAHLYLPLRYFALAKYGRSFAIDQILLVDAAIYTLATIQSLSDLGRSFVVSLIFLISFNCVYEIGYFENDMHAARKEAKSVLSGQVEAFRHYPVGMGWLWGVALGGLGAWAARYLFSQPDGTILPLLAVWFAVLLTTRFVFFIYNRLPTQRRMFVYPCLQILKYGAIFAVFSANPFGALLVLSQILLMWVTYLVYRLGGDQRKLERESLRAAIFAIGLVIGIAARSHAAGAPRSVAMGWDNALCLLAILTWLVFRIGKSFAMTMIKSRQVSA